MLEIQPITDPEKQEHFRRWLAALRSGDYRQTKGCLFDDQGYCCLGVACDVFHQDTGQGEWELTDAFILRGESQETYPPAEVMEYFGIATYSPTVLFSSSAKKEVAALNDEGYSFEKIANLLEATYLPSTPNA